MLRRIRNVFLGLAALVVLALSALFVIAKVYGTEVKVKLVGALNERLLTPVTVSDMDLTLISRFPRASMRLRDVKIDEVRTDGAPPDTLLAAGELFLEFDLWDLFNGSYAVQRIHGTDVRLYPGLDANGTENFLIWKSDTTAASSPIALERVSFDGLSVRYRDHRSDLLINAYSRSLALGGRFDAAMNAINLSGDLHLIDWRQAERIVLQDREAYVDLAMEFGGADGAFHIKRGEVHAGDIPIQLTLDLLPTAKGHDLDLRANGLGLDLAGVVILLPDPLHSRLKRYGMKGEVDLAVHYAGPMEGAGPSLSVGAKVRNGRMKEKRSGVAFSEIYGELAMELQPDGTPRKLQIKDLRARGSDGTIRGDWRSEGVKNVPMKTALQVDLPLADLLRFAGVDTLEQVSGRLTADIRMEGRIRDMADLRASDLRTLTIGGSATLRHAALKVKGIRHRVTDLDVDMALHGNDATVRGLKAEVQGGPIELNGTLRNLMPFLLFDDQRLVIEAEGHSTQLDLAELLRNDGPSTTSANPYALVLPNTIEFDLKARVDELRFEEFRATDIHGTVRMKDRVLTVSPITLQTANGAVLGSLTLDGRGGAVAAAYPLAIDATIKDIDITALFKEFQDFGQEFIGYRHLSGTTSAHIVFHAPLSPAMRIDRDRMTCTLDIGIDKGGIKGHAPLLQVADHLEQNKLIAPFVDVKEFRKKLADVRFERLENRIEIKDGAVHIPLMDVRTTAMDIELSGTHWFDDRIDHHLNFRVGDLLRRNSSNDAFGPIVDDGTGMRIFLHMYGTAYEPQFANDGAMAAERRKVQFRKEKDELRAILREDILGKKADGSGTPKTDPAKPMIQLEWEGDTACTAGAQAKQPKGLGKLLRDDRDKEPKERIQVEY